MLASAPLPSAPLRTLPGATYTEATLHQPTLLHFTDLSDTFRTSFGPARTCSGPAGTSQGPSRDPLGTRLFQPLRRRHSHQLTTHPTLTPLASPRACAQSFFIRRPTRSARTPSDSTPVLTCPPLP